MECVLFRHGIAMERGEWQGEDADRPLTPDGVKKTRQAAAGLRRMQVEPTHLLSSPFVRAHETAKILHASLRTPLDIQLCKELLPDAPPAKLIALLHTLPNDASIICVGHEPNLSTTVSLLIFGKTGGGLVLKKAGACAITFNGRPEAGHGLLQWWLTPAQLRSLRKR